MASTQTARLLGRLGDPAGPAADADLLRAFRGGSQAAFAELKSHGPVVLGACRRLLGHPQDAEDAFQAAFVVLARRAGTVRHPDRLAGWLYAVAVRTARGVRQMRARREQFVRPVADLPDVAGPDRPAPPDRDLAALLDEELARLPDHYRSAVVLCELEGRPRREAATALGVPEGTLSSRLAKARKLLAARLARRGVTAPLAGLAALLGSSATAHVPALLLARTVRGLTVPAAISEPAVAAAEGVIKAMLVSKLQAATLVGVLALGLGGLTTLGLAGEGDGPQARPKVAATTATPEELVRRLGSPRYVHREEAAKQLEALGPAADDVLKAATRDADPEVARRAADVRVRIRDAHLARFRERFLADPEGKGTLDHPLWRRFAKLIGADQSARHLFAAILKDEAGLKALAEAETFPEKANDLYKTEFARHHAHHPTQQIVWGQQGFVPNQVRRAPWGPMAINGEESERPQLAGLLLLGTYPGVADVPEESSLPIGMDLQVGRYVEAEVAQAAARRLYAAWLGTRSPDVIATGLHLAHALPMPELLPLARRVVADAKRPASQRADGLPFVARYGDRTDLPAVAGLTDDPTEYRKTTHDGREAVTQVRDVARVAQLFLSGMDPDVCDFGQLGGKGVNRDTKYQPSHQGFFTDADREAGHAKAKAWLAGRK